MALKPRTFRRVLLLGSVAAVVLVLALGYFVVRPWQASRQTESMLTQGIEAIESGDHAQVVQQLGRYLKSSGADQKYQLEFARSRLKWQAADGGHVVVAIRAYRAYLKSFPDDPEAAKELLPLFNLVGKHIEAKTLIESLQDKHNDFSIDVLREEQIARSQLGESDDQIEAIFQRITELPEASFADHYNYTQWLISKERIDDARAIVANTIESGDNSVAMQLINLWIQEQSQNQTTEDFVGQLCAIIGFDSQSLQWETQPDFFTPELVLFLDKVLNSLRRPDVSFEVRIESARVNKDTASMMWVARRRYWNQDFESLIEQSAVNSEGELVADVLGYQLLAHRLADNADGVLATQNELSKITIDYRAQAWKLFVEGIDLLEADQSVDARAKLKEVLKEHRGEPTFRLYMGDVHHQQGRFNLAKEEWERANSFANNMVGSVEWIVPYTRILNAYTLADRLPEAMSYIDQIVGLAPRNTVAISIWMRSYAAVARDNSLGRQKTLDVIEIYENTFSEMPSEVQAYFSPQIATLYASIDLKREAQQTLASAIESSPTQQILLEILEVDRLYQLDVAQGAGIDTTAMIVSTPNGALRQAFVLYGELEDADQGLAIIERGADQADESDSYPWQLVRAKYLDQVEDSRASDAWTQLRSQKPDDIELLYSIVESKAFGKNEQEVEKLIEEIVTKTRTAQQTLPSRLRLARATAIVGESPTKGSRDKAIEIIRGVLANEPNNVNARNMLGRLLALRSSSELSEADSFESDIPAAINEYVALARQIQGRGAQGYLLEAADLSVSIDDISSARQYLIEFSSRFSNDHNSLGQVARRLISIQDIDSASAIYSNIYQNTESNEDAVNAGLALLNIYISKNDGRSASSLLKELSQVGELGVNQLVTLAGMHTKTGLKTAGDELATQGQDFGLDPIDSKLAYALYAKGYISGEVFENTIQEVLNEDPSRDDVWVIFVRHLVRASRFDEAQTFVAKASELHPENKEIASLVILSRGEAGTARELIEAGVVESNETTESAVQRVDDYRAATDNGVPAQQRVDMLRAMLDEFPSFKPIQKFGIQELNVLQVSPAFLASYANRAARYMPNDSTIMRIACESNLRNQQPAEAMRLAKIWRSNIQGSLIGPDYFIAQSQAQIGNFADAVTTLKPYARGALASPAEITNRQILYLDAHARLSNGEGPRAIADQLEPLLESNKNVRVQVWLNLAAGSIQTSEEAARWIELVTPMLTEEELPVAADAWVTMMERLEAWDSAYAQNAIDILNELLGSESENIPQLRLLARAYAASAQSADDEAQRGSQYKLAAITMDRVAAVDPTNMSHLALAASYASNANDYVNAESRYRSLLSKDTLSAPFAASLKNNLALLIEQHDPEKLAEALTLVTEATDTLDVAAIWGTRGWVELALGKLPESLTSFQKALTLNPESIEGAVGLAIVHANLGEEASSTDSQRSYDRVQRLLDRGEVNEQLINRLRTQGKDQWEAQLGS